MRLRTLITFTVLSAIAVSPSAAAAKDHEWTGFLFKGGVETNPEKGGPFKTAEACFAWGKSKVWRVSDKYMCGIDCKKDAVGRNFCKSVDSESTAAASLARIDAEAEEAAKKAEEASAKKSPEAKPLSAKAAKKAKAAAAAEKAKSVYSKTVLSS